jgi:hypothetical protein
MIKTEAIVDQLAEKTAAIEERKALKARKRHISQLKKELIHTRERRETLIAPILFVVSVVMSLFFLAIGFFF